MAKQQRPWRVIAMTPRVRSVLESRWGAAGKPDDRFVWPVQTRSGHVEPSTVRKQHAKAFTAIAEEAVKRNLKLVRQSIASGIRF